MQQGTLFNSISLTVGDVTRYLRELLDSDDLLRDVWVMGEISNASTPASGHLYFTLKDQTATLKCVMWKPQVLRLRFPLRAGMAVEVHGAVSVYEQGGQYQLYADTIRQVGEGALYQEFLLLKNQLEAEGLFDNERKRTIPLAPAKIGIVTSPTGAALQDMLNTLKRRYPLAEVVIAPAAVQGDAAPTEIVKAIRRLNDEPGVEVILVARGGGSLEDLWAFNDERVVRAVAGSQIPIISGVGHETDFTLTDFAADLRAPTPTAAAELATPDKADLTDRLAQLMQRLGAGAIMKLDAAGEDCAQLRSRLDRVSPLMAINNQMQRLDDLSQRALMAWQNRSQVLSMQNKSMQQRLAALNPFAVLQRGYAIVSTAQGQVVKSNTQVSKQEEIKIQVADGKIIARVTDTASGEKK
ncbi:MAG: exodeoxyribonuclease VII large subunit [Anaerolineaceae bacterium]